MLDNRYFNDNFVAGLLMDIYFPEIFFHWLGMDIFLQKFLILLQVCECLEWIYREIFNMLQVQ